MSELTDRQRIVLRYLDHAVTAPKPERIAHSTGSRSVGGVTRTLWRMEEIGLATRNLHNQWASHPQGAVACWAERYLAGQFSACACRA